MKNSFFKIVIFLFFGSLAGLSFTYGQHNVSVEPCPKAVLLEEYTGKGCGNCPDGAAMAAKLKELKKDLFQIISIHSGYYAEPGTGPDYRTEYGDTLLTYIGDDGFPQGAIDRTVFPEYREDYTSLGRHLWKDATKQRLFDTSDINLWAEASVDYATRVITIKVEGYYYKTALGDFNMLNVALVQNHIKGPQNQGGPDYMHQHMLRDLITGQWGDTITEISKGSFFEKTYTYSAPLNIREVEMDLRNIELVIFVCKDKGDIMQTISCKPSIIGLDEPSGLKMEMQKPPSRYIGYDFPTKVHNTGSDTIKSIEYKYVINSDSGISKLDIFPYILPYQETKISLILPDYQAMENNNVSFKVNKINDRTYEGEPISGSFMGYIDCVSPLSIELKTDKNGDEVVWFVAKRDGTHIIDFGPYPAQMQSEVKESLQIPEGMHTIVLYDTWWDGYLERPMGQYKIKDAEGKLIGQSYEIFEKGVQIAINVTRVSSNEEIENQGEKLSIKVYPNPAKEKVFVSGKANKSGKIKFVLCDFIGKELKEGEIMVQEAESFTYEISLQGLDKGLYLLQVEDSSGSRVLKITKN